MRKFDMYEDKVERVGAQPSKVAALPEMVSVMTSGGGRNGFSGTGDKRPAVYRQGSMDALELPSRMGDKLHYRDGRVEVLLSQSEREAVAADIRMNEIKNGAFFAYSLDERALTQQIVGGL